MNHLSRKSAMMSHEMRTPLTACIGMAEVLLGTSLTERQTECVDAIALSGGAMLQLVNDILDFSKLEADKLVLDNVGFEIRQCVEHSAQVLQIKADEKQLELIVLIHADVPVQAMGDSSRLRQVLFNLLSNAIKFTSKGHVLLSCSMQDDRRCILFEVSDTGIGIPSSTLSKLFQPFVQADSSTSRRFGGTGLGLVISKDIVRLMGGTLEARSEGPGQGSCFSFSIPYISERQVSIVGSLPTKSFEIRPSGHTVPMLGQVPSTGILSAVHSVNSAYPHLAMILQPSVAQQFIALVIDAYELRSKATCQLLQFLGAQFRRYASAEELKHPTTQKPTHLLPPPAASSVTMKEIVIVQAKDLPAPSSSALSLLRGCDVSPNQRLIIVIANIKSAFPDSEGVVCISKPLTATKIHQAVLKLLFGISAGSRCNVVGSVRSGLIRSHSCRSVSEQNGGLSSATPSSDEGLDKLLKPMKFLIIDDVALNQRVITLKLQQRGAVHVEAVSSGVEALEKLARAPFVFDLIFTDVCMPEMDGYETSRAIKANPRYAHVPIIGITGNCQPSDVENCLLAGMQAVLAKPINTDELFQAIRDLSNECRGVERHTSAPSPDPAAVIGGLLQPGLLPSMAIDKPTFFLERMSKEVCPIRLPSESATAAVEPSGSPIVSCTVLMES